MLIKNRFGQTVPVSVSTLTPGVVGENFQSELVSVSVLLLSEHAHAGVDLPGLQSLDAQSSLTASFITSDFTDDSQTPTPGSTITVSSASTSHLPANNRGKANIGSITQDLVTTIITGSRVPSSTVMGPGKAGNVSAEAFTGGGSGRLTDLWSRFSSLISIMLAGIAL